MFKENPRLFTLNICPKSSKSLLNYVFGRYWSYNKNVSNKVSKFVSFPESVVIYLYNFCALFPASVIFFCN